MTIVISLACQISLAQMKFRYYDKENLSCKAMAHKYLKNLARDANFVCRPNYKRKGSATAQQARTRINAWKRKTEQLYAIELEQSKNENTYSASRATGLEYTMDYEKARAFYFTEYADNCGYFNKLLAREIVVVSQRDPDCRVDYTMQTYKRMWRRNQDIKSYYAGNSDGQHTPLVVSPDWPSSAY